MRQVAARSHTEVGTDDDAAIFREARAGDVLHVPNGTVTVETPLSSLPPGVWVVGDGPDAKLRWEGGGTLLTLADTRSIRFRDLIVELAAPDQTAFSLSNTFRCSWQGVTIQGGHSTKTGDTFHGQTGFHFTGNAGDNRLIDCDLNNLGVAVNTASIMNYMQSCVVGTCWRGVQGGDPTGAIFGAGMSLSGITFTSRPTATDRHLYVCGSANSWWLNNVWMEGCDTALEVGVPGVGGPFQFTWTGGKAAASSRCLVLNTARLPTLTDIRLTGDVSASPTPVAIDASGCPHGSATNLTLGSAYDVDLAWFPPGWNVTTRGGSRPAQ